MKTKARHTTKADETPEFIDFWNTWKPRMNKNDGRGAARDEFFRHVEEYGADPQDIADGAKWFIASGGNNGEFKAHAQTWLNRRAYEDGAEEWRTYQARLAAREAEREGRDEKVVQMRRTALPDNHFSKRWERGEIQAEVARAGRNME